MAGLGAQQQDVLDGIARGRVEAITMSEPEAGSDIGGTSEIQREIIAKTHGL